MQILTLCADVDLFYFCSFILKKNHSFVEKGNSSENVFILEKEVDGIAIDDIRNLEDVSAPLFIDEECRNLIIVNDGGELSRNIDQRKKLDVLQ